MGRRAGRSRAGQREAVARGAHRAGFQRDQLSTVGVIAHRPGGLVGVPIAGDDPKAIAVAEEIIRRIGFEPVLIGGLAMGKYLLPGTPLAEEHSPAELRQIAAGLH